MKMTLANTADPLTSMGTFRGFLLADYKEAIANVYSDED